MDLRPTNDNENRLRAGSVSDLIWSFLSSATSPVFQRSGVPFKASLTWPLRCEKVVDSPKRISHVQQSLHLAQRSQIWLSQASFVQ